MSKKWHRNSDEHLTEAGHILYSPRMKKMLLISVLFMGMVVAYKLIGLMIVKKMMRSQVPIYTVATTEVYERPWQDSFVGAGTLRAVQGVDVTSEVSGLVNEIYLVPGSTVKEGDLLVQLNDAADRERLKSLKAIAELAQITYKRDQEQFKAQAVSQSTLDAGLADLKNKEAQVEEQAAMVAKKAITAPFNGKLGVTYINRGHYINPGEKIVSLQALNRLYVDFDIPQQYMNEISKGQKIEIYRDADRDQTIQAEIDAVDPLIEVQTRNAHVQAIVNNITQALYPGMFVSLRVPIGPQKPYLTLPETAVSYHPYGETVFVVQKVETDKETQYKVQETFVQTGRTEDNEVAIISGLKKGDIVVTEGQFKLKNGDLIKINNHKKIPLNQKRTLNES